MRRSILSVTAIIAAERQGRRNYAMMDAMKWLRRMGSAWLSAALLLALPGSNLYCLQMTPAGSTLAPAMNCCRSAVRTCPSNTRPCPATCRLQAHAGVWLALPAGSKPAPPALAAMPAFGARPTAASSSRFDPAGAGAGAPSFLSPDLHRLSLLRI